MKTDIISETINNIKEFLNFCFDISSDFSNEELIFETIDVIEVMDGAMLMASE